MKRAVLAALAVVFLASPAGAQINLTGDWDMTVISPQGENTVKVTFTQDGEKLNGLFKSQMGELPFTGTLTGSDVKFAFSLPIQGQSLDITMTGKVDGATIAGKAQFGGFGEGDWTAKRAAADSAAAAAPAASPAAAAGSASATSWDLVFKTPNGDFPASATFTDDNGKLSGTISSQLGETPLNGTRTGNSLKIDFTMTTPQGTMPVTLTGDIDGDTLVNGKADVSGMGTLDWSGTKKKP
jgi:hypothetical protein